MKLYIISWFVQWVLCFLIILAVYLLTGTLMSWLESIILGMVIWFPVYYLLKSKYDY